MAKKPAAAPATIPMNPIAALAAFTAARRLAPAPAPIPQQSKKERTEMRLGEEGQAQARIFIPGKVSIEKILESVENARKALDEICRKSFADCLWENKSKPENPKIRVEDDGSVFEETFVFKNDFFIQMPQVEEGQDPADAFRDKLIAHGMDSTRAQALVSAELVWKLTDSVHNLQLADGEIPSDELASALFAIYVWLHGPDPTITMTQELKQALCGRSWSPVELRDKAGFLQRVCVYCGTREELGTVLELIKPKTAHTSVKAWEKLSSAQQDAKKLETLYALMNVETDTVLEVAARLDPQAFLEVAKTLQSTIANVA